MRNAGAKQDQGGQGGVPEGTAPLSPIGSSTSSAEKASTGPHTDVNHLPGPPAQVNELELVCEQLRKENARLRQDARELEEERDRDRQVLADLQAECAAYRRLFRVSPAQLNEEELKRLVQDEDEHDCQTLDVFIEELEQAAEGTKHA